MFPLDKLEQYRVCILRVEYWGGYTVEVITGPSYRGDTQHVLWVLIWQSHMRTLLPTAGTTVPCPLPQNWSDMLAAGWRAHLEAGAEADSELVPLEQCSRCPDPEGMYEKVGHFPKTKRRVFGSYPIEWRADELFEYDGKVGGPSCLQTWLQVPCPWLF